MGRSAFQGLGQVICGAGLAALMLAGCQAPIQVKGTPTPIQVIPTPLPTGVTDTPLGSTESALLPEPRPTANSTALPPALPLSQDSVLCSSDRGWWEERRYPGAVLEEQIPVLVYLPGCYRQREDTYRAVYLLHGVYFDERQWMALGVQQVLEEGVREGRWKPALMIMPRVPEPLLTESDGGPNSYEAEFLEGVLPFAEATYRLERAPYARSIGGISRGGVWALEISFRHAELFQSVAALSPSLQLNYPRPRYDPFWMVQKGYPLPRVYLAVGQGDRGASSETVRLAEVIEAAGYPVELDHLAGGHNPEFWASVLPSALDFLLSREEGP